MPVSLCRLNDCAGALTGTGLFYEMGVEATFPLPESVGGMVLGAAFNIVATVYLVRARVRACVCALGVLETRSSRVPVQVIGAYVQPRAMNWLLCGAIVASACLLLGATERRKRIALDEGAPG